MRKIIEARITILFLVATFVLSSCSALPRSWTRKTHFGSGDLLSENPLHQVRAIQAVVENQDKSQIPALLKLMIEGEPSVRENAYWGTTQLTGLTKPPGDETSEYHSYDSIEERRGAVDSWRKYCESQSKQGQANP